MMPIFPGSIAPTMLLNYVPSTDIANGTAVPGSTFTAIHTDQSFTVTKENALLAISVRGVINVGAAGLILVGGSVLIDSAGSPIRYLLGGGLSAVANEFTNALAGANTVWISGLAPGSHTIKTEVVSNGAANAYCRPSSQSVYEYLMIQIMEF